MVSLSSTRELTEGPPAFGRGEARQLVCVGGHSLSPTGLIYASDRAGDAAQRSDARSVVIGRFLLVHQDHAVGARV